MQKVFVSYSHNDADFVDRLVLDLRDSEVLATYDKWLLKVGDSIIEKIMSAVSESDSIVAVISPSSVESSWVKKELSVAVTGELEERKVRVLPALLKDCSMPAMLSDKLYADFRRGYYRGLRSLLEALAPSFYERERHIRKETLERAGQQLQQLLVTNDIEILRNWFLENGIVLAALFGRLWAVSEAIPHFKLGNEVADFLVVNGQSSRYEISAIMLGNPTWTHIQTDQLQAQVTRLRDLLAWCKENEETVRRSMAIRMVSSYGAEQIGDFGHRGLDISAKLICGRRHEYGEKENQLRNEIFADSNRAIDVISYDRIVDVLQKMQ